MPMWSLHSQTREIMATHVSCGNGCGAWDGDTNSRRYFGGMGAARCLARGLPSSYVKKGNYGWVGGGYDPANSATSTASKYLSLISCASFGFAPSRALLSQPRTASAIVQAICESTTDDAQKFARVCTFAHL